MPSADGIIRCTPANRKVTTTFLISGKVYMFSGTFTSDVPTLTSDAATITYNDISQLESTYSFSGHVGATGIEIKLTNGAVINGKLGTPLSSGVGCFVSGWGTWLLA